MYGIGCICQQSLFSLVWHSFCACNANRKIKSVIVWVGVHSWVTEMLGLRWVVFFGDREHFWCWLALAFDIFCLVTRVVKCQYLSCWTLGVFRLGFQPFYLSMASRFDPNRGIIKHDETRNYRFFGAQNLAYFLNSDFAAIFGYSSSNPKMEMYEVFVTKTGVRVLERWWLTDDFPWRNLTFYRTLQNDL